MANNEQAVRDAAAALKTAITEAVAAGYRVEWPSNVAGLDTIAISETGKMKQPEPVVQAIAPSRPAAKPFGSEV
jgi:hypothetical protein